MVLWLPMKRFYEPASFVGEQGKPEYDESILQAPEPEPSADSREQTKDELFDKALSLQAQKVSVSFIQRKLSIGYNRAARMVEQMEEEGIVDLQTVPNQEKY